MKFVKNLFLLFITICGLVNIIKGFNLSPKNQELFVKFYLF